jgi:two-component system cell cycle sensor histidine kinase/response regulator CckA
METLIMIETSSPLHILLVSGNENERILFGRAFQQSDIPCKITECSGAERLPELLGSDAPPFGAAVVDYSLEGISGLELCRNLLEEKPSLPLVLLAETGCEHLVAEALKAGIHHYIIKDPEQGYLKLLPMSVQNLVNRCGDYRYHRQGGEMKTNKERLIDTILECIPDTAALLDIDGNILMINKAGAESLGRTIGEIIGKNTSEVLFGDICELRRSRWTEVIQTGKTGYLEDERDGKYFETWFCPVFDAKGKVELIAVFAHDVTSHKKTEKALKQSYEPDELTASQDEWEKRIHPDDRQSMFQSLDEHFAGKRDFLEIEYRLRTKSGGYKWVLGRGKVVAFNEDGSPARVIGTNIDITDRKNLLERDEIMLKTCIDGFWLADTDGRILEVNDAYCRMSGYSADELLTMNIKDVEAQEEPSKILQHIREVIDKGSDRFESRQRRKDGTIMDLDISVTYLELDGGRVFTFFRDITEHKNMERALAESEQKYRMLVESARDSIATFDDRGVMLFANKEAADTLGCQPEELMGKTMWDLFPREIADRQAADVRKVIETGQRINTVLLSEIQGQPRWYSTTIEPLKNDAGKTTAAMIIARNVDDIRRAEEQIKKLSLVVEQSIDGIAIGALGNKLIYVNNSYAQMHGYTIEEMIGMKVTDLYPLDKAGVYDDICHQADKLGAWKCEIEHVRRDGSTFPAYLSVTKLKDDKGNDAGYISVCRDMTEYKRTQEMLRIKDAAIASSINGIAICDAEGNLSYVNHAFLEMWGYENENEVLGRNAVEFWEVQKEAEEVLKTLLDRKGWIGELSAVRKDGSTMNMEVCATLVKDENGKPISMMGSFIDITETKRNQEELIRYRGQMARAEQLASLGTLSATVAHQLTQPLTVIRLSIDNALDELHATSSSATVIKRLKGSVTQVSNITSIIENFRNFARKSSGKTVAEVNLKAVALRIASLLSESARSAGIQLRVRHMDDLPCPWMNENDLEQVFFALIENAIQAADDKKTRQLVISGAVKGQDIELRFSDDCGGIEPANIDKVFEPFFTTKSRGQGTGLGLCIVKDVVSRNGGHVRVQSEFGKGTSFIVSLPIEKNKAS